MKVIVCGAGQVGSNIAAYLASEKNDVTVIDTNAELIARLNDTLDVNGIVGFASYPEVLEQAGARDAELIIAATFADEVNMVACQVAHSIFNVPKKIARIRSQSYLNPLWSNLFSREHLPIDVIISPEMEVARAISERLLVPGAFDIIPLADGKAQLVGVVCQNNCPIVNTPLRHLTNLFPDLLIEIVAIVRGDQKIIPDSEAEMRAGDEVYFVTATEHLSRSMAAFGHEELEARRILVVGGGNIGLSIGLALEKNPLAPSVKLVEFDPERAAYVAGKLSKAVVIQGSGLDKDVLQEANVARTETVIAVTNDDETNILSSLQAKRYGCERAITLINNTDYSPLLVSLGIDAVVNPRAITVSTILQYIRRGRMKSVHSIRDGFAEVIEAEALETSPIVHMPIREVDFAEGVIVGAIVRAGQVIIPKPDTVIKPHDHVIIFAAKGEARNVEKMFAVRLEFF